MGLITLSELERINVRFPAGWPPARHSQKLERDEAFVRASKGLHGLGRLIMPGDAGYTDPASLFKSAFKQGQSYSLPEFRDQAGKVVARYAEPQESVLKTAYRQASYQLPAFYQDPRLGPWGVDPQQAYAYWVAQLQRPAYQVWGSPGVNVMGPQPIQGPGPYVPAAYNPYAGGFPQPGTAVESF